MIKKSKCGISDNHHFPKKIAFHFLTTLIVLVLSELHHNRRGFFGDVLF